MICIGNICKSLQATGVWKNISSKIFGLILLQRRLIVFIYVFVSYTRSILHWLKDHKGARMLVDNAWHGRS